VVEVLKEVVKVVVDSVLIGVLDAEVVVSEMMVEIDWVAVDSVAIDSVRVRVLEGEVIVSVKMVEVELRVVEGNVMVLERIDVEVKVVKPEVVVKMLGVKLDSALLELEPLVIVVMLVFSVTGGITVVVNTAV
jgi:hypothetical protein